MTSDPAVGELSESAVLRRIMARLGASRAAVGPGDDAAVLAVPDGRVVATTDTLVHGPDFRLAWSSGSDLGWKAAAVNLADIAAMGARPVALLVALAMPDHTRLSFVEDLADGLRDACATLAPGCAVEGGDLTGAIAKGRTERQLEETQQALAVADARLSAEEAWSLAHLDEDWQIEHWGTDEEAFQRREARWKDMQAAAKVLGTLR